MCYNWPKTNSVYTVSYLYLLSCHCLKQMELCFFLCHVALISEVKLILTQKTDICSYGLLVVVVVLFCLVLFFLLDIKDLRALTFN